MNVNKQYSLPTPKDIQFKKAPQAVLMSLQSLVFQRKGISLYAPAMTTEHPLVASLAEWWN